MTGRLLGIALHRRPRGPMEVLEAAPVTFAEGVLGDYRGALKPGRNRRQVTVMALADWEAALADLGVEVPWQERRVNLLVDGLDLFETTGSRLVFAGGVELQVTVECDPCRKMELVASGLEAALTPRWRGGVCTRVIGEGQLAIGDEVRIERP